MAGYRMIDKSHVHAHGHFGKLTSGYTMFNVAHLFRLPAARICVCAFVSGILSTVYIPAAVHSLFYFFFIFRVVCIVCGS